ncbi:hypothetical protein SmJEL517_g01675 [Synchytrium microbalum]|uniref:Uncharacterized protein n=1 Tax=Synchytrium microbalum TaxID=1806994 RepID=A0A507CCV4_9FUNG|nr:uncharacterized protein SmJEL517_g01675 [Synchytrium microbalum]TPX35876.1 hypothetical protein SmJEL517_g01675 [Synchytrium microbalum]
MANSGESIAMLPNSEKDAPTVANVEDDIALKPNRKWWQLAEKDKTAKDPPKNVPYLKLFRFASPLDRLYIFIGLAMATAQAFLGCGGIATYFNRAIHIMPLMTIVFGNGIQAIITYSPLIPGSADNLNTQVTTAVIYLCIIGVAMFTAAYLNMTMLMLSAENQSRRIRQRYFAALLRQDIGYFDATQTGELTSRMSGDLGLIQDGIGEKVGVAAQSIVTFIAGFVIAFVRGWRLALVLLSVFPVLAGVAALVGSVVGSGTGASQDAYAEAGSIASAVISSIRTVVAFGGEANAVKQYSKKLDDAMKSGIKRAIFTGMGIGAVIMVVFNTYALAFYYGSKLIGYGIMNGGEVLNVFFSVIIGAFSIGQASQPVAAMSSAQGAAYRIFETIDRVSPIDYKSKEGKKLEKVDGNIEFKNVDFRYPTRPDVQVLANFNLTVKAGSTVALVGGSGSGKSTIVKLVERFYDAEKGAILIDGIDVREYQVNSLRQHIGIVSQEPVLFDASIRRNILYGLPEESIGSYTEEQLDQLVKHACKLSNAWDFVTKLPKGMHTMAGEAGSMLSGGQKQRISIARSVIKNPSILLLDEATAALDTISERRVQAALDNASKGRTTIVVAHRLSTIKNADVIVCMKEGVIVETGTHNELLDKNGYYSSLVEAQNLRFGGDAALHHKDYLADEDDDDFLPPQASPTLGPRRGSVATSFVSKMSDGVHVAMGSLSRRGSKTPSYAAVQEAEKNAEIEERSKQLRRPVNWWRLIKMNAPEWWILLIGLTGSVANGVTFPVFALVFGRILAVFGNPDIEQMQRDASFWASMFVVLSVVAGSANFSQMALFGIAGERLTRRLREMSFRAIVSQEIAFFDEDKNSTGALTAQLSENASLVAKTTSNGAATLVQVTATLTAGLVIAFSNSWQLTLIILAIVPLIAVAGAIEFRQMTGTGSRSKVALEESNRIANEAISNIRTVVTLAREETFLQSYVTSIEKPHQIAIRGALTSSIGYGISQGAMFFAFGLSMFYGSRLILWGIQTPQQILSCQFAVIFTAQGAGQILTLAPDITKSGLAVLSIFDILDRLPRILASSLSGQVPKTVEGNVSSSEVEFTYPTRPDTKVLNGLNIEAKAGTVVALVGSSGCGKSTVIALLERFYDVDDGEVSVDGIQVKDWIVSKLRSNMALVGQEPVLFYGTIKENIAYGVEGDVSMERIEEAARISNCHEFIASMPAGYETMVGEKGAQLSGGQKQRVALARALIRQPKILLLDEATSALDSQSEAIVQEALDRASKGRTTVVIAHRLSTIQNADKIYYLKDGIVAESGTHKELVQKGGLYAELAAQQELNKQPQA